MLKRHFRWIGGFAALGLVYVSPGKMIAKANYEATLFDPSILPEIGETAELFPKGPTISREEHSLTFTFGPNKSAGWMQAEYRADGSLAKISTFNKGGRLVSWTTYTPLPEGGQSIETAYDLGEEGKPTRWERTEPNLNADGATLLMTVELLDKNTGKRIVETRRSVSSVQFLLPGNPQEACDAATPEVCAAGEVAARAVNQIAARFQPGAQCGDALSARGIVSSEGNITMLSVPGSPICIDSRCGQDSAARTHFAATVQRVMKEGVSCMAKLGMDAMSASSRAQAQDTWSQTMQQIRQGQQLTAHNERFLQSSFALRNAAQLAMLYNQGAGFGETVNRNQQNFAGTSRGLPSASQIRSRASASMGPIRVFCPSVPTVKLTEKKRATSTLALTRINPGSATLAGSAGWPSMSIQVGKNGGVSKFHLFHEMLHMLGYPHNDKPDASNTGGLTIPVHTACPACCFNRETVGEGPSPAACGMQSDFRQAACDVCAGKGAPSNRRELEAQLKLGHPASKQSPPAGSFARQVRTYFTKGTTRCGIEKANIW